MRHASQPRVRGGSENPYPGNDGATTWNASRRAAAVGLRVGQPRDDVEELDDEPGQPWTSSSGKRVLVRRARVDEVDRLVVDGGPVVLELVQPRLLRAPVVRLAPVVDELGQVVERDPVLPARPLDLVRDTGLGQAVAQVVEDGIVDVDLEALDHRPFDHGRVTGSVSQPRTVDVGDSRALSRSTSHSGNRFEDLVERDAAFEAGERGAEAEVDAVAEREVLADVAMDVEPVAVGEAAVVAVRRADQEHHHAALRHRLRRSARRRGRRSGATCGAGGS